MVILWFVKLMETNLVFVEINMVFLVWVLYVCKWGYGDKRKIQRRECLIYGIGLKGLNRVSYSIEIMNSNYGDDF